MHFDVHQTGHKAQLSTIIKFLLLFFYLIFINFLNNQKNEKTTPFNHFDVTGGVILNAQDPQFNNPGFEVSSTCDLNDCNDYVPDCINNWWMFDYTLDVTPNAYGYSIPWLNYSPNCMNLNCSPDAGERGLVLSSRTNGGIWDVVTDNPFHNHPFEADVYNIGFITRFLGASSGGEGMVEIYGSNYEFVPPNTTPQSVLNYLGESELIYSENDYCKEVITPISFNASEYPFLIFRFNKISPLGGTHPIDDLTDIVIDELFTCNLIDVDLVSSCIQEDDLCLNINFSFSCLPCRASRDTYCPYSLLVENIIAPNGNVINVGSGIISPIGAATEICIPEQFAIDGTYSINFSIQNTETNQTLYATSTFDYLEECNESFIAQNTTYTVDNTGTNGYTTTGTITVQSGATLTIEEGVTLAFCEGASLIIEPNARVKLYGTLTACGDIWEGVKVYGTSDHNTQEMLATRPVGYLLTYDGAEISYANRAVDLFGPDYNDTGGALSAKGTTFKNFYQSGIRALPFENHHPIVSSIIVGYKATITACDFTIAEDFQPNYNLKMIDLNGVRGVKIKGSSFVNKQSTPAVWNNYGTGIYSFASNFILTEGNKFHGLTTGIYNGRYPGQPDKGFIIKDSEFRACGYGFYNLLASFGEITNNAFYLGKVRPEIASYVESNSSNTGNSVKQIGAMMQGYQTGFVFEENHFMLDANPTHLDNIGTISSYLGPVNNRIRRNFYDDMLIGNLSNGENAVPGDKIEGLIYLCNANTNPSNLSDFAIVAPVGICTYQNGVYDPDARDYEAAGNIFSYANSPVADINNQAGAIEYTYYDGATNEMPREEFSAGAFRFQSTTIANECIQDHFPSGDTREKKVNVEEAESKFWEHHTVWTELRQEYYGKLDGGNTLILLDEISNTNLNAGSGQWPIGGQSESWMLLNSKLQEISPYLSADVVKAVSEKGMYAKEGLSELLYANPDVKLDKAYYESLLSNLTYDFTSEEIEDIKTGIRDIQTGRTELEAQIGYHRKQMDLRAGDILRTLLNEDEIEIGLIQQWYANLSNDFGDLHLAMQAATEGDYSTARQLIEQLPLDAHYDSYQTKQHGFTTDLTELIIQNLSEGIELDNLDEDSKDALWSIYNQSESIAKYQAAVLLHINKEGDFMEYEIPENIAVLARQWDVQTQEFIQYRDKNNTDITLAPNPASDEIVIKGNIPNSAQLLIRDMNGKIWKKSPISNIVKISDIPNGIYIYQIISGNEILDSAKLVITH